MRLEGKRILLFAGPMFEDVELLYPLHRFREQGADVIVTGMGQASYTGKNGLEITVDAQVDDLGSRGFDAVVIPGGYAPDHFRRSERLLALVREAGDQGKTIAAICHGPWVLVSAGLAKGRRMTSFFSIRDDLVNAGADWVDEEVVVDGNVITSRKPDDLGAFCRAVIDSMEREGT